MEFEFTDMPDLSELDGVVPVSSISTHWLEENNVTLDVLRLDQIHPEISGNKWYKLKNNLKLAIDQSIPNIVSFGGAWSNHIHALAAAGKHFQINTTGIIRGERSENLSDTLKDAEAWGMQLFFISRSDYRRKNDPVFLGELLRALSLEADKCLVVPEGGGNEQGVRGCQDILTSGQIDSSRYDEIWLACGTGATLAGIARSAPETLVQGVAVLKGGDFLNQDIRQFVDGCSDKWQLTTKYHFGGYARNTAELLDFIDVFESDTGITLDPVYTGKLFLALKKSILEGRVSSGSRLLAIHTGGLQGRRGIRSIGVRHGCGSGSTNSPGNPGRFQ